MTKEREEKLLTDTGEMRGLLERLVTEFDALKPTLASCTDVETVDRKITDHIDHHRWSFGTVTATIFGAGGLLTGIVALFVRGKQ